MRKIKKLVDEYIASLNKEEAIVNVVMELYQEISSEQKARRARSNRAIIGIINERAQRWRSFQRNVNESGRVGADEQINLDGFMIALQGVAPELHALYQTAKKDTRYLRS